jgi:hypothetical protein
MKQVLIVGAVLLAGLAGSAAAAKDPGGAGGLAPNQCFRIHDIQNSVQVSETRLNILTSDHRYIRLDTTGRCFDPPFNDYFVIQERGNDMVCSPIDVDISAGPPGFKTPCIVDKLTQMTPAEVAALPKKEKP